MKRGYRSLAQKKWAHSKEGTKQLGGKEVVAEWDRLTGKRKLPKRVR